MGVVRLEKGVEGAMVLKSVEGCNERGKGIGKGIEGCCLRAQEGGDKTTSNCMQQNQSHLNGVRRGNIFESDSAARKKPAPSGWGEAEQSGDLCKRTRAIVP